MNDSLDIQPTRLTKSPKRYPTVFRWVGSLLVIAFTLGVIAFLVWIKYSQIQAAMQMPPPPEMPVTVGIRTVETLIWQNSTTSIGTILAPRSITVNNEMPGTVAQVLFQPGQIVEEGALLLSLDSSVEQAQLKAALSREKFALATLQRNRQLAEENSIAEKVLDEVELSWQQSQAQVEELEAMIARKTIVAPFRAQVGLSDVQKGQYLSIGSLITTLQSVEDHFLVEFTLAQNVVGQLEQGDTIDIESADWKHQACIIAIDALADRQTRNVRVRAKVENPPTSLSPGESVSVLVNYGTDREIPAVPAEAIRRSPQGTFVFLAEQNKAGELRASARPVIIATAPGPNVGIAGGVLVGEQVVVEGSFKLQDGALISVLNQDSESE